VRWSGDDYGARPRHVRVRVVSRFSALQKACKRILIWRQMRAFFNSVSEWCGRAAVLPGSCPAPARFLPDSCPVPAQRPVPARFLPGSCPVPARFLPSGRFLPGSCPAAGSCPVPARFLPGSCPTAGQDPPRSGGSCHGSCAQEPGSETGRTSSRVLHHACADARLDFFRKNQRLFYRTPTQLVRAVVRFRLSPPLKAYVHVPFRSRSATGL
jgi:hypothetical protein